MISEQDEVTKVKRLMGKVALVTGGSRGIGAAIAARLAEEGASVAISYANNKDAADKTLDRLNKLGSKAIALKANVSSENDTKILIDEINRTLGQIDILVNNAGIYENESLQNLTVEQYEKLFQVNVRGVIVTTTAALKMMRDGGRIINISSIASKVTTPDSSLYCATKAAVEALTRNWAQELGVRKITVNAVAPGATATDMMTEELWQFMIARTALGRLGQPEDIAAVVAFLASDDGRWVTGQTIHANGGLNI